MDLWSEMKLLEQTNLTRDGAWLELVRTKQKRLEKQSQKPVNKQKSNTVKPISKRRQRKLEKDAKKEHLRLVRERRQERNLMRKLHDSSLTGES